MTDTKTKTSTNQKDNAELAKELARRKANPVKVEKPQRPDMIKGRKGRVTVNGVTIPATVVAVVTK